MAIVAIEETSEPASGSVMAKAAMARPLATAGSHRLRCASLPARVIGIEPRHWRAKTASASGEAAARASRIRQQARRSGSGQCPPQASGTA